MNEEILRIQKMVAEGKITAEESVELIESVRSPTGLARPASRGPGGEPRVRDALADGLDAIGRWPISRILLLILALVIVAVFPFAGAIGVIALAVYFRGKRAARDRAVPSGLPPAAGPGTAAGSAATGSAAGGAGSATP